MESGVELEPDDELRRRGTAIFLSPVTDKRAARNRVQLPHVTGTFQSFKSALLFLRDRPLL
jgi:hypothetical protein